MLKNQKTDQAVARCRPIVAIPGKRVRCQWGQFGMRALPFTPQNIDLCTSNTRCLQLNHHSSRSSICLWKLPAFNSSIWNAVWLPNPYSRTRAMITLPTEIQYGYPWITSPACSSNCKTSLPGALPTIPRGTYHLHRCFLLHQFCEMCCNYRQRDNSALLSTSTLHNFSCWTPCHQGDQKVLPTRILKFN